MEWTPVMVESAKIFGLRTEEISQAIYRAVKPYLNCHSTAVLKFMEALKPYYELTPTQDTFDFIDVVIDDWFARDSTEHNLKNQTSAILWLWPGWRLESFHYGKRKIPLADWRNRWCAAGRSCGWIGASKTKFMALKESPIWKHLGNGAGGYCDTYGLPYPPFAIGSDIGWMDATEAECKSAGIVIKKASGPLTREEQEIREAVRKYGMPKF